MATQKLYVVSEAALTWDSAGTTELLTMTSVADGAGRQGAMHDFALATAKAGWYTWRYVTQCAATPTLNAGIRVYWKSGDGTNYDNDDGTGDIAVSAEVKLANLDHLRTIVVDEAAADKQFSAHGRILIGEEEGGPVIWNASGAAMTATAAEHIFTLTPIVPDLQAAA